MRFYKKLYLDYILFFGIVALFFAIFSAFRVFGLGVDYKGYLEIFYGNAPIEPVFTLLKSFNQIINKSGKSLVFIYFLCAFIGLYLKGSFYAQYSNNFFISILFYIFTIYFLHEYTQIRAAIALGICYLSVKEINRRQFKRFVFRILVAMSFHYSAILMFPVYFYCHFFRKQKRYIQFLWITFVASVFFSNFLHGQSLFIFLGSNLYSKLFFLEKLGALQNMDGFSIFNICYFLILIMNTIFYFLYKGFPDKNYDFTIFQLSSLSAIMFYCFFNLGFHVVTFRFSEFFIPYFFIVIPKIISRFKEKIFLMPFVVLILAYYTRTVLRAVL
ncbi:EpsG family protein [Treponema sp. UBA753]|uniref:EpsG family protein n=1 Tax=Treponema sp. UBA753 TaxID=1947747 RepID=UPI0025DF2E94|nr:EpsG family protein [Treponema sp. UBA753]